MNKIDKSLNRNATETLTFTIEGDYSADTIYLTAKRKVSDSTRLIDHECDSVTYDALTGLSTLTFNILPSETLGITYSLLTYDIKVENSSIDRDALISGNLKVNLLPRLDSDLVPDAAENVVVLDISELADDTFLYKTTVADVPVLISKTIAEMKTALGLPKEDITLFVSLLNMADTSFIQSITEKLNPNDYTITISRSSAGKYSISFAETFANFSSVEAYISIIPIYDGRVNHLPDDFEVNYVAGNNSIEIQFYESGSIADIPADSTLQLFLNIVKF